MNTNMLQGNFFTIGSIQNEAASTKVVIEINAAHAIFKGHFPGQPVVPGACLLQMVKEVLQNMLGKEIRLTKTNYLKFISLIDPSKNNVLQLVLTHTISENGEILVLATASYDTTVCFKFNGIVQIHS